MPLTSPRWFPRPRVLASFVVGVVLFLAPTSASAQDADSTRAPDTLQLSDSVPEADSGVVSEPDSGSLVGDSSAPEPEVSALPGAAVVLGGDTLWVVERPLGPFPPAVRAAASQRALDSIARGRPDSLAVTIDTDAAGSSLVIDGVVVATFTAADALAVGVSADSLASLAATALRARPRGGWGQTLSDLARGGAYTVLATAALIVALLLLSRLFPRLYTAVDHEQSRWIRAIRIQRLEVLSAARISQVATLVLRGLRGVLTVTVLYFFLPLVLSFFPPTAGIADQLVGWVLGPLGQAWSSIISYLPNIFRIAVILAVMYYALQLVHLVFEGLRSGRIRMRGFYPDWALPTYQIVRFLLLVLTAIVVWPYLPMSDSPGFRGIAAFLGLLLTFGSASAIANMVGGVVLIYMRSFQIGDRVQISSTVGDVIEKGLLVTRIRTSKNVNVTIPNSMVLGDHLINYSRAAVREGVILHTSVTLGYDVPWRTVHEVLKGAATGVEGVLETPEPFVLQTALDDFYVAYELNVYTRTPNRMAGIYSDLHERIQDGCNEAGIEILSPHFRALRDGHAPQVPGDYVKGDQAGGAFRIRSVPDRSGA